MNFQPKAFLFALGTAVASLAAPAAAHAQIGVNIQLGHPAWGPVAPQGSQYYYIPEIDGYYDLQARDYIVQRNGRWNTVANVPGYDPRSFHPVVVNYRGRQPWAQYNDHHARYFGQGNHGHGNNGRGGNNGPGNNGRGGNNGPGNNGHDDHGRDHR